MRRLFATAVLLLSVAGQAADGPAVPMAGRAVVDVIEEIRAQGYGIAYSSRLIPPDLLVRAEPEATAPLMALLEVLEDMA